MPFCFLVSPGAELTSAICYFISQPCSFYPLQVMRDFVSCGVEGTIFSAALAQVKASAHCSPLS